MNRKVYFAGSIRGGRDDAELYKSIIEYIGRTDNVLTEHIGNLNLNVKEDKNRDVWIYERDTAWLKECDLVIAECTSPSLGVGYELSYAEGLGKEVHILYRRSKSQLSAMLAGDKYFCIHPYETADEAFAIIDSILA